MRSRDLARKLAPGLLVALPVLPWVGDACARASWAPLGRDQGIFQYVAWALGKGAKAYRDVRDVNGPLALLVHELLLALGGADERTFRILDLALVGLTAGFAGACLPWLGERRGLARAATMALAAWAVVTAHYLSCGWWDIAQRESFFDAFVAVSMGLQWLAQARLRDGASRSALGLLAAAAAASLATWFGKPTYALVTAGQVLALLVDDVAPSRLRRALVFVAGGALGAAVPFAYLLARGDVAAWARISLSDVPAMYRFIWPRTVAALYGDNAETVWLGLAPAAVVVALVASQRMPRAALSLATLPVAGLASVLVQSKGFTYHFHPVLLGASLASLALVDLVATRSESVPARLVGAALALALGGRSALVASRAWYPGRPADPAKLEERLAPYARVDYFPYGLRRAAEHVAKHVGPDETVQTYGMDPYVLFLARRRSATPYIYVYDLDVDAALHGSFDEGGPQPTEAQRERIRAMQAEHERDMLARLAQSPPGAFVLMDRSPLMTMPDALEDFRAHCPEASRWFASRYRETASFEGVRVWLRADLADRAGL